jgi:dihydroorotase
MKVLLKNVTIVDTRSSHHLKKRDILINGLKIDKIARTIKDTKAKLISLENAHLSLGWLDIGTQVGEPGLEHKETVETVCNAAMSGGYTTIACFPNTEPPIQKKSDVQFLRNKSINSLIQIYPVGAISKDCQGKDMNELIDMADSGAVAFSDGEKSIRDAGTLLRALQYVKSFDGVIIHQATDTQLVPGAYVHEGEVSTRMGLKGIPALAEELQVERDLKLLEYTESKLLLHNLSSLQSVPLLKKSGLRNEKLAVSVAYNNLIFHDEYLKEFDPSYKTIPPIRTKKDMNQLVKAVKEGLINIINSNHSPQDLESKSLEFANASFGNIGLETCFAAVNTILQDKIGLETIVDCLAYNGRKFLKLNADPIEEGSLADLTLFDPQLEWTFQKTDIKSKSKNTPFIDTEFKGKVLGVINNGQIKLV